MAEAAANRTFDGVLAFPAGIDSSRSPYLIDTGSAAFAENVTFRGDYPKCRPSWQRRLVLTSSGVDNGYFQGASFYRADNGINQLVFSMAGKLYSITPNLNYQVQNLTIPGDPNSSILKFAYFVQAENYLINNDGQASPIIYDGVTTRRAGPGEITTGTVAAYSQGRIWYAVAKGTAFRAGDLVRSSSGSQAFDYRDAVLKLTENTLLTGGGDFSIPNSSGRIKAMAIPAVLDTSLGQGPLQVFTDTVAFSVNAPIDRLLWQQLIDPVQTVSQLGSGATSHRTATLVNGDIFYRSLDGIRSFYLARRTFSESWANTPISNEVKRVIDSDNIYQLQSESAVVFKNRFLNTVWGRSSRYGIYHVGVVALDFDPVSSMRNKQLSRWEGVWTGLKILQLVVGVFNDIERCFAFVLNNSYQPQIELWEMTEDFQLDNGFSRIPCAIEGPGIFRGSPFAKKQLESARIFISEMVGTVDFNVKYRPDNWPCWVDWASWSECASPQDCTTDECLSGLADKPQYRPRMGVTQPPDDCNDSTGGPIRMFYQMQLRVQWTGIATLNQLRVDAINKLDPPYGDCRATQGCKTLTCCPPDPLAYEL